MRPLLIIPPAPQRVAVVQSLFPDLDSLADNDLRQRLELGVGGAQDAFAVVPQGGLALAGGALLRRGDVGILSGLTTLAEHRGRGHGRSTLECLLSWFDMTGGRRLYAVAPLDAGPFLSKFGFSALPAAAAAGGAFVRLAPEQPADPFAELLGRPHADEISRADWPALVMLLLHRGDVLPPHASSGTDVLGKCRACLSAWERGEQTLRGVFRARRLVAFGGRTVDGPPWFAGDPQFFALLGEALAPGAAAERADAPAPF